MPTHVRTWVLAVGNDGKQKTKRLIGSGFLLSVGPGTEQSVCHLYLVTNRHLLGGLFKICLCSHPNTQAERPEVCLVHADGTPTWTAHPQGWDIAVLAIEPNNLQQEGSAADLFLEASEIKKAADLPCPEAPKENCSYTLVFPLGRGPANTVDVKVGPVANIGILLKRVSQSLLIDILVPPGARGGPVILQTGINPANAAMSSKRSHLIGIVSRSLKYAAIAGREQPESNQAKLEKGWLAQALPMDYVMDTIKADLRRRAMVAKAGL